MNDGLLQKLVEDDFGIKGRGKWLHSEEHDSLVVNSEAGTFFWNSTGQKGNVYNYLTLVRGLTNDQAREFLKNSIGGFSENSDEYKKQVAYDKLVDVLWAGGKNKRDYWYKRCLTDSTIDRYKLGYYDGWSLVPIYENGEFINFQCRRDEPEKRIKQWYRTGRTFLYNEGILPFTKVIYITEGLVDAILLSQEGFPTIAASGANSWQDAWFSKFNHIDSVYYFEDNDKAGRVGAKLVANSLGLGRVKIVSFTGRKEKYDVGDFFKDGGTAGTLKEHIVNNSKYIFELENIYGRTSQLGKSNVSYRGRSTSAFR